MSVGSKLRYYRKKRGFTQRELVEGICHTTYISKIENNNILPPTKTLRDFCYKLDITLEDLYQRVDGKRWRLLDNWFKQIQKGRRNDIEQQYEHLKSTFEEIEEPFLIGYYYLVLLRYFILIRNKQKAGIMLQKVKDYEDFITLKSEYLFSFGLYEYHYGNLNISLDYFEQTEQAVKEDNLMKSETLYYKALVLSRLSREALSTIYIHRALEIYNKKMDFERITDCHLILGINFNLMGDYDVAEEYFYKVINAVYSHNKENNRPMGIAYHNLGNIYSKQGKSEKSIDILQNSLQFKAKAGDKINSFYLLTKELFAIGDTERGKNLYFKTMSLAIDLGRYDYQIKLKILYFENTNGIEFVEFRDLLKRSINYFKKIDVSFSLKCFNLLSELYAKSFHYKKAYECLRYSNQYVK